MTRYHVTGTIRLKDRTIKVNHIVEADDEHNVTDSILEPFAKAPTLEADLSYSEVGE